MNPTRCSAGLSDQPCYEAPDDLQIKIVGTQLLTSVTVFIYVRKYVCIKSVHDVVDFYYFLLLKVNQFIDNAINATLHVIYCLIFSIHDRTLKKAIKTIKKSRNK